MRLLSWNINGFRAVVKKGFWDWFAGANADMVCLQEIKALVEQIPEEHRTVEGYEAVFNPATTKKGYSGTAVFTRPEPVSRSFGLPETELTGEGRLILLEYEAFYLANVYFPNGQKDDERLAYKMRFYDAFLDYMEDLRRKKPIVICGDVNTAHREIDIARPKDNATTSGFLPEERAWIDKLLTTGYVDTLRHVRGDEADLYTWWAPWRKARERNVGWRIDYFFVSNELKDAITDAWIEPQTLGSDHCPVGLELKL